MQFMIKDMLSHFEWIYVLQQDNRTFDDVREMLAAMNPKFSDYLDMSLRDHLKNAFDCNDELIDELISAITQVNYGQSVDELHVSSSCFGRWLIESVSGLRRFCVDRWSRF